MDIQFNNLRQEKDAIGVVFCDNKCRLIGYGKKLDQLSKKYISNIIKSDISFQERNSKNFDYSIIHQPTNIKLSKLYVFGQNYVCLDKIMCMAHKIIFLCVMY